MHLFVFPAFCLVKFLTIRGQCLCILCSKSLTFRASDENRQTILQAAAHSLPATRDVSSVLKPMFQSGVSSSTSWAFYPPVRGAESEFLVWSISMPQSIIYLRMKGASAVVKSVIAD